MEALTVNAGGRQRRRQWGDVVGERSYFRYRANSTGHIYTGQVDSVTHCKIAPRIFLFYHFTTFNTYMSSIKTEGKHLPDNLRYNI